MEEAKFLIPYYSTKKKNKFLRTLIFRIEEFGPANTSFISFPPKTIKGTWSHTEDTT